jgi:hypothetical protein
MDDSFKEVKTNLDAAVKLLNEIDDPIDERMKQEIEKLKRVR